MEPLDIFAEEISFFEKALKIFRYQVDHNPVYARFVEALNCGNINDVSDFPLIPVEVFRDCRMVTHNSGNAPDLRFRSSGTTGSVRSVHEVMEASVYRESILRGFNSVYDLNDSVIWGYTPGYSENPESSLIYMIEYLISQDDSQLSRFLPLNEALEKKDLAKIKSEKKKLILFGAAFGLLDLIGLSDISLPSDTIVIETGGMKTYKREMTRSDLHENLAKGLGLSRKQIHSEYGMTELLSQAYSTGDEWFTCPEWMQVRICDPEDPLRTLEEGEEGLIGIIDLANMYSCSFLLTGDRGVQRADGSFKVLGRWNPSDLRGCNFLIDSD